MQQIASARSEWREKQELKLEESWTSLDIFDRHQRGRISVDLESNFVFKTHAIIFQNNKKNDHKNTYTNVVNGYIANLYQADYLS